MNAQTMQAVSKKTEVFGTDCKLSNTETTKKMTALNVSIKVTIKS